MRRHPSPRVIAITAAITLGEMFFIPSLGPTTAAAADAKMPSKILSVSAEPGPRAGEITLRWNQDGKYTTGYRLETALTIFSKTNPALPKTGRKSHVFEIPDGRQSYTLSAAQVKAAGAGLGTGNHLWFRFYAVNTAGDGTAVRAYPGLQAVMPKVVADKSGPTLRVASFNVRTAKATTDARPWLERVNDVASQIADYDPAIVAVQELGPGRADGKSGTTTGTQRQTTSLLSTLDSIGAGKYKLVRTTPYVANGTPTGTQGTRILYDNSRLQLLSLCPDTTSGRSYSSSCSVKLPLLAGDDEALRRRATYARFEVRSTGRQFYLASVHLDVRHSADVDEERAFGTLRSKQISTALNAIDKVNTNKLPVIVAGDLNSWQNIAIGHAPHDKLVSRGYYDTAHAETSINLQYATSNKFVTEQRPATNGFAPRLDMIAVTGSDSVLRFENVTDVRDNSRPSDHNMIYADIVM